MHKDLFQNLSYNDCSKISQLLSQENASDIIEYAIEVYSKDSLANCLHLIKLINAISDNVISHQQRQIISAERALTAAVVASRSKGKSSSFAQFVSHLETCYALGITFDIANKFSPAVMDYFDEFIEMLRSKSPFDYSDEDDMQWLSVHHAEKLHWFADNVKNGGMC